MSDVKRYSLSDDYDGHDNYAGQFLREDDTGDYVKAVDFDALRRERDGLREALKEAYLTLWDARNGNALYEDMTATLGVIDAAIKASGGGEVEDGR